MIATIEIQQWPWGFNFRCVAEGHHSEWEFQVAAANVSGNYPEDIEVEHLWFKDGTQGAHIECDEDEPGAEPFTAEVI